MIGPFNDMLLPMEPKGVAMIKPSPQKGASSVNPFSSEEVLMYNFNLITLCSMPLNISSSLANLVRRFSVL